MKSSLWLWWIISFHISGSGALASSFRPKPPSSTSSSSKLKSPTTGAGTLSSSSSALPMTNSNEQANTSPSSGSLGHPPEVPSLEQYRKFALPCLGLWIAGPLLSLVDTAFIGLSGAPSQSAQQLAALGPATTFFDGGEHVKRHTLFFVFSLSPLLSFFFSSEESSLFRTYLPYFSSLSVCFPQCCHDKPL